MVKKCFLIIFLSIFLWVAIICFYPHKAHAERSELQQFCISLGVFIGIYWLFFESGITDNYGQNTAQVVIKSGWKTYKNPSYVKNKTYDLCVERYKALKGPLNNPSLFIEWPCSKTLRVRKSYSRGKEEILNIRIGGKTYSNVDGFVILPGIKIYSKDCDIQKLKFSINKDNILCGQWGCY